MRWGDAMKRGFGFEKQVSMMGLMRVVQVSACEVEGMGEGIGCLSVCMVGRQSARMLFAGGVRSVWTFIVGAAWEAGLGWSCEGTFGDGNYRGVGWKKCGQCNKCGILPYQSCCDDQGHTAIGRKVFTVSRKCNNQDVVMVTNGATAKSWIHRQGLAA